MVESLRALILSADRVINSKKSRHRNDHHSAGAGLDIRMSAGRLQRHEGEAMKEQPFEDSCEDLTQEFTLNIPCVLAARAETYARDNDTTITSVVIEALDHFLRMNS